MDSKADTVGNLAGQPRATWTLTRDVRGGDGKPVNSGLPGIVFYGLDNAANTAFVARLATVINAFPRDSVIWKAFARHAAAI